MHDVIETQTEEAQPVSKTGPRIILGLGSIVILGLLLMFGNQIVLNSKGSLDTGLAPDFTLSLFDGGQLTLSDLRGQVVVVNFWASWCIPCRDEAPILEMASQRYQEQGVVFVGIAYLDTDKESLAFLKEFEVSYPNGPDIGTKIARDYRITGVPETFFIGRDGEIVDLEIGPLTESRLISALDKALQGD